MIKIDAVDLTSDLVQAEKAALRLIARAEQNTSGLSQKLLKKGYDAACIQAVIEKLCETGLLDDCRYARLWLESRISCQASSPLRLLVSLRTRGINCHDAESALKETLDDEAELQLLHRFVQKYKRKHAQKGDDESDSGQTLKYFLRSEGFSSQAIQGYFDNP